MYKLFLASVISLAVSLSTSTQAATYGGGSGTLSDPYQIWTPQHMNTIGANPDDWDKKFLLMDNINMSIYIGTQYKIIGNLTKQFTGTFNGNGHIISNLTYTTTAGVDNVGLFGYTGSGGLIKNLGLVNVSLSSGGNYVGGLVGSNNSTITSCYVTGSITGDMGVGGLVGYNGIPNIGYLTNCYATGSVTGNSAVGGLVGVNGYSSTITGCYATSSVNGTDSRVGGLVGNNYHGTITNCYATGSVSNSGTGSVGGFVGIIFSGTLRDCYATGSVSGTGNYVGGLVGLIDSFYPASIIACFWDIQTSGQNYGVGYGSSAGVTGETTAGMKNLYTFMTAGWDFTNTDGDPIDWSMPSNDYPRLAWDTPPECIDDITLLDYIGQWKRGEISMSTLMGYVARWKYGLGC